MIGITNTPAYFPMALMPIKKVLFHDPISVNVIKHFVVNAAFLFFETSKLWALIMYIL